MTRIEDSSERKEFTAHVELKTESSLVWRGLYNLGGISAIVAGALTIMDIMVYVIWPQPSNIESWFALFQRNWIVGLLDLDILGMIVYVVIIPTILALYVSLRRASESWAAVSCVLTFVGLATYFASNTAFSLMSLSNQYAGATTEAQRAMFLASGQAMLAMFYGSAFTTSFFLVSVGLLVTSFVMMKSAVFGRKTAYLGVLANLVGLAEQFPVPGIMMMVVALVNGVGLGIWFILIGRTLLHSRHAKRQMENLRSAPAMA